MIRRNAERSKKCDREEGPPALQLPEKAVFFIYDKHPQEETMDIRQLHYFLVLCDEMNYTRASLRWKRNFAGRCFSVPTTNSPSPTAA